MAIKNSELILNSDGSIYHLHLKPSDIADTLIFVGDQERVGAVTKYFDRIDFEMQSREFKTQTGYYKGKRLSVISTGIGPDNIDIVINELDALWNSDITITDTASVKNHLRFPSSSNIVLSHPIAGSDKSGVEAGVDDLFIGKKNVICNPFNADQFHVDRLKDFWKHALQMRVSEMSVKDHDILFAVTSHLPHLISYALIDSIRLSATNVDDNAGGGLKEFIRLSGSNPEMWSEIFELNGMNIIKSLAGMQLSINNLLELVTKNKEIPSMFSHSEMLKNELEEIKNYKEDKF